MEYRGTCYALFDAESRGPLPLIDTIEIPLDLARFELPRALQTRLQLLLDRQDACEELSVGERDEAEALVDLSEFLSLLQSRARRAIQLT